VTEGASQNDVEITDITRLDYDRQLVREFSLDLPKAESSGANLTIDFAGWSLGRRQRVIAVEISCDGEVFKRLPLSVPRRGVMRRFADVRQTQHCGFVGQVGVLGLPRHFVLVVTALLQGEGKDDRIRVPVAEVRGHWRRGSKPIECRYQPLMLTCLGRSGTSWAMRLLSEHPGIAAQMRHPYEFQPGVYFMHLMKVLGDPADHDRSSHPERFVNDLTSIGHNPFAHPRLLDGFTDSAAMREVFGSAYHAELERFCKRSIELVYDGIAKDQGDVQPRYFAEKQLPGHVQVLSWALFDDAREIILVRDFRDLLCSAISFNEQRRILAFGRENAESDEQWIRNMATRGVQRLLEAWRSRQDRALLVRYEDLIRQPTESLKRIFEYADLDAEVDTLEGILERAGVDTPESERHRTSKDAISSLGRWRSELPPHLLEVANHEMKTALEAFGYTI
jgi:hypothetical protein